MLKSLGRGCAKIIFKIGTPSWGGDSINTGDGWRTTVSHQEKERRIAPRKVVAVVAAISYLSMAMLLIIYHPTESWPPTTTTACRYSRSIAISSICRLFGRFTETLPILLPTLTLDIHIWLGWLFLNQSQLTRLCLYLWILAVLSSTNQYFQSHWDHNCN